VGASVPEQAERRGEAVQGPLELLVDSDDSPPALPLGSVLEAAYGGPLRLDETNVFANFVSSLDGVVSIPSLTQSSSLLGDRSEADRLVMGILRSCADAVLIGSGTLRASPRSLWTGERVYPEAAAELAELRERLGLAPHPVLVVLTASGTIDVAHPALEAGSLVLTTEEGEKRLRRSLPEASELVVVEGSEDTDVRAALGLLRERGHRRILSEAGPTVLGSLLAAGAVDDLFLTLSPLVAGRSERERRLGLVEGRVLLPEVRIASRLTSVRRHGEHLFLRYRFR
jgi:riboflavin biosynthesis pyrimidine reductase